MRVFKTLLIIAVAAVMVSQTDAAIRNNLGFASNVLARNDDGSAFASFGFEVNFFGNMHDDGFVNNNGNLTFDAALPTYTPFNLSTTNTQILAPFFADVDTRTNGLPVTYGQDTVNGRAAFGVNWFDVTHYSNGTSLNTFQLVMIERFDTGAGNFDFEFNYGSITWEAGTASGSDPNGLGGNSARVGWSNGATNTFELDGSAENGAFINGGPHALQGRCITFEVRNGSVNPQVPEPSSALIWGLGLGAAVLIRRRSC